MNLKLFVCVPLVALSAAACHKASATSAAAAGTPAASGTPGSVAQGSAPGSAAPGSAAPVPPKPVPAQLPDVVARVNGEDVKKADLERMIKTMEGRAGQPVPPDQRDAIYRGALDQLVVYTLLKQETKARGIKIDDAEIDRKVQ